MGCVQSGIAVNNPREPDPQPISTTALANIGALTLCIREHLALQLRLEQQPEWEAMVADSRSMTVPYVGPIRAARTSPRRW
jgi:hypothetical protein